MPSHKDKRRAKQQARINGLNPTTLNVPRVSITPEPTPDAAAAAASLRQDILAAAGVKEAPIVVVTGFVASTVEGTRTTLKRSGSDFSATIFARLMAASRITMWKNVNGVYTADPRRVPEAFPIESLKYDEAMELAYFGAQVLHPSAMLPCIDDNIPVYVRNIFNPSFEGTVIEGRSEMAVADAITSKSRAIASTCAFDRGVARLRAQR